MVSDFSQGTLNTNPSFSTSGYFSPQATGGAPGLTNMIDGNLNPNILEANPESPSGSAYAIHVWGTEYDYTGNPPNTIPTQYPAFQVFCYLKNDTNNPYTDLSGFTGIQFLVNVEPDDTNETPTTTTGQRRFAIAIAPQTPAATAPGGTCPAPFSANCYNYFWAPTKLPKGTPAVNNGWVTYSSLLNNLTMDAGYGTNPLIPAAVKFNANPAYAKEVLFLLWKFGDNGNGKTTYTDFWIDNIQFY